MVSPIWPFSMANRQVIILVIDAIFLSSLAFLSLMMHPVESSMSIHASAEMEPSLSPASESRFMAPLSKVLSIILIRISRSCSGVRARLPALLDDVQAAMTIVSNSRLHTYIFFIFYIPFKDREIRLRRWSISMTRTRRCWCSFTTSVGWAIRRLAIWEMWMRPS